MRTALCMVYIRVYLEMQMYIIALDDGTYLQSVQQLQKRCECTVIARHISYTTTVYSFCYDDGVPSIGVADTKV